ncbi:MAG: nuclear transport factor 2 family protein [Flavobacteriales bacterium]|nr:nuclear transport factor 2 family protein [Flavobacteriales bacterium]
MTVNEPSTAEAEVLIAHDTFWQSYALRDLDARFAVCSDDVTFFGTGLHERAVGKAQYRAMNQKGVDQYPHAFTIEYIWKEVRIWGEVAWVEGDTYWIIGTGDTGSKDLIRQTTILKKVDGSWLVAHVHGSDPDYRLREGEHMTHGRVFARNAELEREVVERTRELREEKKRSDDLLLNILPEEVAAELKVKGHADAKHFDKVTILFTDFKGFTQASEKMSPQELVEELNTCFKAFDGIITARGIEKIKTIGDAYMCAGGLPVPATSTPADVVHAALEMQAFMILRRIERDALGKPAFQMRVGIHTGPVVAGIVGVKKFAYDIWGDTVNTASRLESSGEVGQVNISASTYSLVKDEPGLSFTPRGKVQAKGKGEMEMYFVGMAQPTGSPRTDFL